MEFNFLKEIIINYGVQNLVNDLEENELSDDVPKFKVVYENGPHGDGSDVEMVLRFEFKNDPANPVTYIKINGYYTSYDGTEWNNRVTRVYPKICKRLIYSSNIENLKDDVEPNDPEPTI